MGEVMPFDRRVEGIVVSALSNVPEIDVPSQVMSRLRTNECFRGLVEEEAGCVILGAGDVVCDLQTSLVQIDVPADVAQNVVAEVARVMRKNSETESDNVMQVGDFASHLIKAMIKAGIPNPDAAMDWVKKSVINKMPKFRDTNGRRCFKVSELGDIAHDVVVALVQFPGWDGSAGDFLEVLRAELGLSEIAEANNGVAS